MVRRSTPNSHKAERYFPVRVRASVPPGGFGLELNAMYAWLDNALGRGGYWVGSDADLGRHAVLFYFADIVVAKAFVDRFRTLVLAHGSQDDQPS